MKRRTGPPIVQVDAFTDTPFSGNPAGVCLLDRPGDPAWMQAVASEMNLSETAFVVPGEGGHDLRWFTPKVEVDLCGHATLASAHVLWTTGRLPEAEAARFRTRSGLLTATRRDEWIELDFPAAPPREAPAPEGLFDALGVGDSASYRGTNALADHLVELDSEGPVRQLDPDFEALRAVEARGVIVTSRCERGEYDFVSRFFAPQVGIDEDPVTGSAHCCLGPFWAERLDKTDLVGYQASARGGVVRVRALGDRVVLGGQAVTVLAGELAGV